MQGSPNRVVREKGQENGAANRLSERDNLGKGGSFMRRKKHLLAILNFLYSQVNRPQGEDFRWSRERGKEVVDPKS